MYLKSLECRETAHSARARAPARACAHVCESPCPCIRAPLSCDIHTHTPARKSYTDFLRYSFVLQNRSTNYLGHGYGYECHSQTLYVCAPARPRFRAVKNLNKELECRIPRLHSPISFRKFLEISGDSCKNKTSFLWVFVENRILPFAPVDFGRKPATPEIE